MTENFIDGLKRIDTESEFELYQCEASSFSNIIFLLESDFSYLWLLGISQERINDEKFLIKYSFFDFDRSRKFSLAYQVNRGGVLHSVKHLWKNALTYENKILQTCGLTLFHPHKFRVQKTDPADFLPKYEINLSGALFENNNKLRLSLQQETIFKAELERGNFEIGIESMLEAMPLLTCYELLENYYPLKGCFYSQLLSHSLESVGGVKLTDRAKGLRMVILEFQRILDHAYYFEKVATQLSNQFFKTKSCLWIEKIQSLLISFSGNEFAHHTIRFGGVTCDVNQSWSSRVIDELRWFQKDIKSYLDSFLNMKSVESLLGHQLVSKEDVFQWSMTGPLARSVGVNIDHRKKEETYFYSDVDFEIPIGVNGTVYDYMIVLLEEMLQSGHIITQVLDNLPTGSIFPSQSNFEFFRELNSSEERSYIESVESYLGDIDFEFTTVMEGPRGIIGLDLLRSPQGKRFNLLGTQQSLGDFLNQRLVGETVDQAFPIWSALDLNLKEIEK